MAYRVRLARHTLRDLSGIYDSIGAQNSDAAFRWYCGLKDAIYTLRSNPDRCPVTPEALDLRHLLYGNKPHVYRVIYRVLEKQNQVQVLHIRHGARQAFKRDDLT
jgi:plasmid stabilization system protein ParE